MRGGPSKRSGAMWMFPKVVGFPPKSSTKNRVFHYFHHPFWGTPIFGNTHVAHAWVFESNVRKTWFDCIRLLKCKPTAIAGAHLLNHWLFSCARLTKTSESSFLVKRQKLMNVVKLLSSSRQPLRRRLKDS